MSNARLDEQKLDGKLTQSRPSWTDQNGPKWKKKYIYPFLSWASKLDVNL